ncbi:ComF family protein [Sphingobacterium composti Ten et al. 2007 non Yoo et al. 2007]|uniref:ComF family protein n=1 Tax=Sphingobacterium composti TaxID=363260 RepID=UPI0013583336|nr:ComF family protein [Sphingobacterium composti Ten et al. 2007 non Yoo et al. 2007]
MELKNCFNDFVHLLFPRLCAACNSTLYANEEVLCTNCMFHLPFTDFHLDANNETARQLWGKIEFESAFSMLHLAKSSWVETLLHKLKYKNQPEIGVYLGKLYAKRIGEFISGIDLIVPIPVHKAKLRKRGYNQAAQFAIGLSDGFNIPCNEQLLLRHILSVSQIEKSRTERYDNVKGEFSLHSKVNVKDKHILLVDDVLTTGATICEAGQLLIENGAKISIATIARA